MMGNTTATYEEVKQFLDQMKTWLHFFNGQLLIDNKPKNEAFLSSLEWRKVETVKQWLLTLDPEDYFEGPDPNEKPRCNDVWKFGKRIEGHLCYIKVFLLSKPNVYCISFHIAEHDMWLPLKSIVERI